MSDHEFNNSDKLPVLSYREFIRTHLPNGSQGYVVEDADIILRVYGSTYNADELGTFMLVEVKARRAAMGTAQNVTFGLIDGILRKGDPKGERYKGYYSIQTDNPDWNDETTNFWVNGKAIKRDDLIKFLSRKLEVRPIDFIKKSSIIRKFFG